MTINDIIQQYTSVHFLPKPLFLYVSMVLLSTNSSTIPVTVYFTVVMLGYDWCLGMVINTISVHNSGGLLPNIILLTQDYYQWGTRLNTM